MDECVIHPTTYRLPNLRYLRPVRIWLTTVGAVLYFGVSVVAACSRQEWVLPVMPLIVAGGFVVAYHPVRVCTALGTKYRRQTQTITTEFSLDCSPVDAAVLLQCRTRRQFSMFLIQALIDKGALRVVRQGSKVQLFRDDTQAAPLYPYERFMLQLLVDDAESVAMSQRRLVFGRHVRKTEQYILRSLRRRDYFRRRSAVQEFFIEYLRLLGPICMVLVVTALVALTIAGLNADVSDARYGIDEGTLRGARVIIAVAASLALVVPLVVFSTSVYSKRGDNKVNQVIGYYWYLRTVFLPRIGRESAMTQRELVQHGPFIEVLFGVKV